MDNNAPRVSLSGQTGLAGHTGLAVRIITGLLLAAVLVACLVLGGLPFFGMLMVVSLVALWEFYQLFWRGFSRPFLKLAGFFGGAAVLTAEMDPPPLWPAPLVTTNGVLCALTALAALSFLFAYGRGRNGATLGEYAVLPLGILYIPLAFGFASQLSLAEMFLVVGAVIASDTGAYFVGSALGRHKMWPAISPKKSWEGALGGLLLCMPVVLCVGLFAVSRTDVPAESVPWPPDTTALIYWTVVGVALAVAAPLGDFFESALKRVAGCKDSSRLLPGHGGMLDRIDSLLFALPAYMLVKTLFPAVASILLTPSMSPSL